MRKNKFFSLFVLMCFAIFGLSVADAQLKPITSSDTMYENARLITELWEGGMGVWGDRESDIPWGQGPVNYTAGFSLDRWLPNVGWIQAGVVGWLDPATCAGGTSWGCGTGYKTFFQIYCDANNVLAFGIIWDPGVHQMIGGQGLTVMIEGLANGQPVAGYWPLGSIDQGGYHDFYLEWGPTYIKFMVDAQESLVYTQPMTVNQVSLSCLNAARLKGDFCAGYFHLWDWSMGLGAELNFIDLTWDTPRMDSTADILGSTLWH